MSAKRGFTLIELSIVLVIIGLMLGGLLVARALLRSAELNSLMSEVAEYDTAIGAFKLRFRAMPGDITRASYLLLGANGDGNGMTEYYGEAVRAMHHLSQAELIAQKVNGDESVSYLEAPGVNFPSARIDRKVAYVFMWLNSTNCPDAFWHCTQMPKHRLSVGWVNAAGEPGHGPYYGFLTPDEAFGIDSKLDDGLPALGKWMTPGRGYNRQDYGSATFHNDSWSCADSDNEQTARYRVSEPRKVCSFWVETTSQ